jgi:acetoin utilization protein AcuB
MTTVGEHMSPAPHPVGVEQNLAVAARFMRKHQVRHLPVLHGGEIVGALSARDVALLEAAESQPLESLKVEDAMSDDPYVVTPDTPLVEVLRTMAQRHLGSVLVAEGRGVQGIFTATDAVKMLAERL